MAVKSTSYVFVCSFGSICMLYAIHLLLKNQDVTLTLLEYFNKGNLLEANTMENTQAVFIGGFPSSGAVRLLVMLDGHPSVNCGMDFDLITKLLLEHEEWLDHLPPQVRAEAGLTDDLLDSAVRAFIRQMLSNQRAPGQILCNKDPIRQMSMDYWSRVFPKAKYILMIRDGRGAVHSLTSRKLAIDGMDTSNVKESLQKWSNETWRMYGMCTIVMKPHCLPVYYENIVNNPKRSAEKILEFLGVPWDEHVLRQLLLMGLRGETSSRFRSPTIDAKKTLFIDTLSEWVVSFPPNLRREIDRITPMLKILGYDTRVYPPDYTGLELNI